MDIEKGQYLCFSRIAQEEGGDLPGREAAFKYCSKAAKMKGKWRRPDLLDSDLLTTLRCQLELQYTQREGFERPALSRLGRRARDEMGGCVGLELAMQWSWNSMPFTSMRVSAMHCKAIQSISNQCDAIQCSSSQSMCGFMGIYYSCPTTENIIAVQHTNIYYCCPTQKYSPFLSHNRIDYCCSPTQQLSFFLFLSFFVWQGYIFIYIYI